MSESRPFGSSDDADARGSSATRPAAVALTVAALAASSSTHFYRSMASSTSAAQVVAEIERQGGAVNTSASSAAAGLPMMSAWTSVGIEEFDSECEAYVTAHPHLAGFIEAVTFQVRTVFGEHASLRARLIRDPEEDDSEKLFVIVRTGLPYREGRRRFRDLETEWWLLTAKAVRQDVGLGLAFV